MYPLLGCSLLVWAVIFEKFLSLGQFRRESHKLQQKASALLAQRKINEAKGVFASASSLVSLPHDELFDSLKLPEKMREERLSRRLSETEQGLRRFLWILGTIGAMAPFIGLLGTVVGIIKAFGSMGRTGKGGFAVVAAGLSEALVATAAGILVAIVAVMFYNFFQVRLKNFLLEFKNRLEDLQDLLIIKTQHGPQDS